LAQPKRFDAGHSVFDEGTPVERFFLLLDGHIRVVRTTPAGDQIIVLHIASGQLFGIGAALGHTTYPATAMTADESLTLSLPNRLWQNFVAHFDGFATETYKVIGGRMDEMVVRIVDLATKQVEQRVASAMVRLITQNGRKVDAGIEVDFAITRQNISDMTGTTLFTVIRLLSAWEKDGIVASERRRITVTEPGRLQAPRLAVG
jgi:CRP/FNR family transcriptional regulator, nitrogen oxide reductase regulator